jgi:hypothetical protein
MVKTAVKQSFGLRVNQKRKRMKGNLEFTFFICKVKKKFGKFSKDRGAQILGTRLPGSLNSVRQRPIY